MTRGVSPDAERQQAANRKRAEAMRRSWAEGRIVKPYAPYRPPRKITGPVEERLAAALGQGLGIAEACAAAGVHRVTLLKEMGRPDSACAARLREAMAAGVEIRRQLGAGQLGRPIRGFVRLPGGRVRCDTCGKEIARSGVAKHRWVHADPAFRAGLRARRHLAEWGLTAKQLEDLLERQGGRCAICHTRFARTPCLDHDHSSSVVRGLLCHRCNAALGMFDDSPARLRAALTYLRTASVTAALV